MKKILLGLIIFFNVNLLFSQVDTINFKNPSFEDKPNPSVVPSEWTNCGFPDETPPDTQPNDNPFKSNFFEVNTKAQNGLTYLGMVTRNNNTWETVTQELEFPLLKDELYSFSLFLAMSDTYISINRQSSSNNSELIKYNKPIILRIWGSNISCLKEQLLYESPPIDHVEWEEYFIEFITDVPIDFISLEAYYDSNLGENYCGNILIDNCSQIFKLNP